MLVLGFIACALLCPIIRFPQKIKAEGIFVICIVIGAAMSYVLYRNQNVWLDPLLVIAKIGLAYLITQRLSFRQYATLFSNTMAFLSGVAIFIYVLLQAGISIPSYTYTGLNGRTIYHTIWLCSWAERIGAGSVMGPFWESGLYSSMAIYALLCEGCFTGQKPRKLLMAIILIGIYLSNSTAGYILAILAMYIIVFQSRKYHTVFDFMTLLIMALIVFFSNQIIEMLVDWKYEVFWKLAEQTMTFNTRLFSPIACLRIFLQSPLTGLGMSYATAQYNLYKSVLGMDALTSTSAFMLAAFGIWGIAYTVFLCRGAWRQRQFSVITRILLCALLLMIVNKEPHTSILFTYIMMFYLNKNIDIDESETSIVNERNLKMDIGQ